MSERILDFGAADKAADAQSVAGNFRQWDANRNAALEAQAQAAVVAMTSARDIIKGHWDTERALRATAERERDEYQSILSNDGDGFGRLILSYIADIRALKEGHAKALKYFTEALESVDIANEDNDPDDPDLWGIGGEGPYSLTEALRILATSRSEDDVLWQARAEAAEATVTRQAEALRLLGANEADPLRAEHQRLKDDVVGDAMSEYYAREKYRTGGDPWKALHQDNTSPRAALAAFEAQHPEVK